MLRKKASKGQECLITCTYLLKSNAVVKINDVKCATVDELNHKLSMNPVWIYCKLSFFP